MATLNIRVSRSSEENKFVNLYAGQIFLNITLQTDCQLYVCPIWLIELNRRRRGLVLIRVGCRSAASTGQGSSSCRRQNAHSEAENKTQLVFFASVRKTGQWTVVVLLALLVLIGCSAPLKLR